MKLPFTPDEIKDAGPLGRALLAMFIDERIPPRRAMIATATLLAKVCTQFGLDLDEAITLVRSAAELMRGRRGAG